MSAEQGRRLIVGKGGKRQEIYSRVMLVRIYGTDRREPYGDIVHSNLRQPVLYHSLSDLIFSIDKVARSLKLLGDQEEFQSLKDDFDKRNAGLPAKYQKEVWEEHHDKKDFRWESEQKRIQNTVCVELVGGIHMSFQGRLWGSITEGRYLYFRSALELMYLFLQMQEEQEIPVQQDGENWMGRERQQGEGSRKESLYEEVK